MGFLRTSCISIWKGIQMDKRTIWNGYKWHWCPARLGKVCCILYLLISSFHQHPLRNGVYLAFLPLWLVGSVLEGFLCLHTNSCLFQLLLWCLSNDPLWPLFVCIYQMTFYSRGKCSCLCGVFIYLKISTTYDFLFYPTVYKIPLLLFWWLKIPHFWRMGVTWTWGSLSCRHFITQHFLTFWSKKIF